jgi:hypothetical protein
VRRASPIGVLVAAMLAVAGCGTDDADVESVSRALAISQWRSWTASAPTNSNALSVPALCPAHVRSSPSISGYIQIGRDLTTNRYKLAMYGKNQPWLSYTNISSSSYTFNSKPVCASLDGINLEPPAMWSEQIAVVGKRSSDNLFYIQLMKVQGGGSGTTPPPVPSVTMSWAPIGTNAYSSAPFVLVRESNEIVVGGRRSDNRVYVHVNPLQWNQSTGKYVYNHATWEAPLQAPALPSGWTPIGDPAIGHIGNYVGEVQIFTRAQSGSSTKVFTMYMFVPWRYFGDQWYELTPGSVAPAGDFAVEFERRLWPNPETTIYYRGTNNRVYYATGDGWTWEPFNLVDNANDSGDNYTDFISAPGVLGSSEMEGGHIVAMRRQSPTNQYYVASPVPGYGY